MIPSAGTDTPSLNMLAGMTFPLQPVFLSKLMLMTINWSILVEGIKLLYFTRKDDEGDEFDESTVNVDLDKYLVLGFAGLIFIPPILWTLFWWVLSLSFIFTLFFLVILIVFVLLAIFIYVVFLSIINNKNNEWMESQNFNNIETLSQLLEFKIHESVREMLWWIPAALNENGNSNSFVIGIQFSCAVFILAPIVVFGTWLAMACYNGADFTRSLGLIFNISFYEFRFGFHTPPINFSDIALLADFQSLGAAYLNGVNLPPGQNIKAARSLYGLSQLMSIIKAFIAISSDILNITEGHVPNARFYEQAQESLKDRFPGKLSLRHN